MRASIRPFTAGLAAILTAGCQSLAPHYVRPDAPVPARWSDASAQADQSPRDPPTWDQSLRDPRLQALIKIGLRENRSLRAALADTATAQAQSKAQRAALLPEISAGGGALLQRAQVNNGVTVSANAYSVGAGTSSYVLDLFGKQRSLSNAAFEAYLATDAGGRAARIIVVSEIASQFVEIARQQTLRSNAAAQLTLRTKMLDLVTYRAATGYDEERNVEISKLSVAEASRDALEADAALKRARHALELAVGAPVAPQLLPDKADQILADIAEPPSGLDSRVLLRRPDIIQAEHNLQAYNANIGAARADLFPSISLTGEVGRASLSLTGLLSGGLGWVFSPTINLPIFDGGHRRANLRAARAQRDRAIADYQGAIQAAFRNVGDALAEQERSAGVLDVARGALAASRRKAQADMYRFKVGIGDPQQSLVAQESALTAERNLVDAIGSVARARIDLFRAIGFL